MHNLVKVLDTRYNSGVRPIDTTGRSYLDVSHTVARTYHYNGGSMYLIQEPAWISFSHDGHRIIDVDNVSHWVKTDGLVAITWLPKEGEPNFII